MSCNDELRMKWPSYNYQDSSQWSCHHKKHDYFVNYKKRYYDEESRLGTVDERN